MTDTTLMTASTDSTASSDGVEDAAACEAATEQTQEQQTADEAADDADKSADDAGEEGDKDEDEPKGAPEEYEDFAAPEGVELDAEVLGDFKALGKELNLPQAEAQKVVDLGLKLQGKWAADQAERFQATRDEWTAETKADPEIGGDKLTESLASAKKVLDSFGTPALRELLNDSGLGNHPEFVRAFAKVGKAISEDTFVGVEKEGGTKSAAKTLYPGHN